MGAAEVDKGVSIRRHTMLPVTGTSTGRTLPMGCCRLLLFSPERGTGGSRFTVNSHMSSDFYRGAHTAYLK